MRAEEIDNKGALQLVGYLIASARYDYILSKVEYEAENLKLRKARSKNPRATDFYNAIKQKEKEVEEKRQDYRDEKVAFARLHYEYRNDPRLANEHETEKTLVEKKKAIYLNAEKELEELKNSKYAKSPAYQRYSHQEEFTKIKEAAMKENLRFFQSELFDSALYAAGSTMSCREYIAELDRDAMQIYHQFLLHPEYLKYFKEQMKNYEENGSIEYDFS